MNLRYLVPFCLLLCIASCKKDVDIFNPNPLPPPAVMFDASAFVEVVDDAGRPVENALVVLGSKNAMTDELGVVHLEDVPMSSSTYLTVDKDGYFHGSRRFNPSADKTHFIRVRLLQDAIVAQVDAQSGGSADLDGGVRMTFPANAVSESNGAAYTGMIHIAAQPITADDPNLSDKMPGDLVGRMDDGSINALASMGMMAVELRGDAGQELQVREGSAVTMRMDIPSEMLGNAPASIPMWYFDEEQGLWIEDGNAALNGNAYEGNVTHFTYWNYDAWFPIVKWGATFLYENGDTASGVSVCVTILSLETTKCALTNEDGVACGMVAANELLLIEVKDPCGNVVFSEQVGPFSDTTITGPYTIPAATSNTIEIEGSAVNCDGDPVTNGFARIQVGERNYYVELDSFGNFSTSVLNCNDGDVTAIVIDQDALKQSLPQTYPSAPVITIGTIIACETLTELVDLEVVGVMDNYLFFFPDAHVEGSSTAIVASDSSNALYQFFYISFAATGTGIYPAESEIVLEIPGGGFGYGTDIEVTVTYFGDVGDFIQGSLTGTIEENQGMNTYPLNGTFSVMRE